MGFRSKIRDKIKKAVGSFSGEYSAVAPEEIKPYERPGVPAEDAAIPKARLKRPKKSDAPNTSDD